MSLPWPRRPTGKLPAQHDMRLPQFKDRVHKPGLPPPPAQINWYAAVGIWPTLANDSVGDCVVAAAGHCVQQLSTYAGASQVMTEQEAVEAYSAIGGYNPIAPLDSQGNNPTDEGLYVMGPWGLVEYWKTTGLLIGGARNVLTGAVRVNTKDPEEWKQALQLFGGLLLGFQVPASIINLAAIPYTWTDPSGPSEGGHEVWVNGLTTMDNGTRLYEFVSWGARWRATEEFFMATTDEIVAVADKASLNARGVDGAGVDWDTLQADMEQFGRVA